jgi:hypothetical protein
MGEAREGQEQQKLYGRIWAMQFLLFRSYSAAKGRSAISRARLIAAATQR